MLIPVDEKTIPWEYELDFVGQTAGHNPYIYHVISQVLTHNQVSSIIEFGTQTGALTMYLGLWGLRLNVPVMSFDIEPNLHREIDQVLLEVGVPTHDLDVFSDRAKEMVDSLVGETPAYLICDGGDKEREFATYAPLLPTGSVISVHDWGTEVTELRGIPMRQFQQDEWTKHDVRFATVIKLGDTE